MKWLMTLVCFLAMMAAGVASIASYAAGLMWPAVIWYAVSLGWLLGAAWWALND